MAKTRRKLRTASATGHVDVALGPGHWPVLKRRAAINRRTIRQEAIATIEGALANDN